jgi:hypothetical protein
MKWSLPFLLSLPGAICPGMLSAQLPVGPEAAVVKITAEVEGHRKVGSGFIVHRTVDLIYIITASHVVEGDAQPKVEFFTRRNLPVPASVVGLEGGDPKGLALLMVTGQDKLPPGLGTLSLAPSTELKGGDEVTIIGFPQGAGPWAVLKGNIVSRQGRNIDFSAAIDEGSSGGPMIKDGQVVSMVTEMSTPYGRATPAASIQLFLEGWGVRLSEAGSKRVDSPPSGGRDRESVKSIRLRSKPAQIDGKEVEAMMKKYGFSDCKYNPGAPSSNKYQVLSFGRVRVVIDYGTGLMWQPAGSRTELQNRREAEAYVSQLNQESYAGFSDWRLPTIEELASLGASQKKNGDLWISPLFSDRVKWCWSVDTVPGSGVSWGMDYTCPHPNLGGRREDGFGRVGHARAVRSVQRGDTNRSGTAF